MNTAERLIRNLCDAAIKRIEGEKEIAVAAIKQTTPIEKAPQTVRNALAVLRRDRAKVERAKAIIKSAGFDVPDDEDLQTGAALSPCYSCTHKKEREIGAEFWKRKQQIDGIKTSAAVKIYGKPAKQAGEIVRAVEQALLKI